MRVRVYGSPLVHRLDIDRTRALPDDRLALTRCGVRFAWCSPCPAMSPAAGECLECRR